MKMFLVAVVAFTAGLAVARRDRASIPPSYLSVVDQVVPCPDLTMQQVQGWLEHGQLPSVANGTIQ